MSAQIKVLVVDDSSLVRKIITDILELDPEIKVIGTATNGEAAIKMNNELNPDVITMDIEMPVLDGLTALRRIISTKPRPVIMLSVFTQHGAEATFKALEYGAVDFVPKPSSVLSLSVNDIGELLRSKIKSVYKLKIPLHGLLKAGDAPGVVRPDQKKAGKKPEIKFVKKGPGNRIVGIGTSTGGPAALMHIFKSIPENFPSSLLVVQHMPEGFTRAFAERLNATSTLTVKEAEDGDRIMPGCGYIAPGNQHISIVEKNSTRIIRVYQGDKVSGHRPSIDVLFNSMAEITGSNTIGVIMTGMGKDGADGTLRIKEAGGYTVAQNEETSIVYGMNRVAVERGAVHDIVPLSEIPKKIVEYI